MTRRPKQPKKPCDADWFGRLLADVRKAATVTTGRDARAIRPSARRKGGVAGDAPGMEGSRRSNTGAAHTRLREETRDGATA